VTLGARAAVGAYKVASTVARALPEPVAMATARAFGLWYAASSSSRRRMIARHLQRLHGKELEGATLRRAVRQSFDSYARYWMESFRLPDTTPAELDAHMTIEGRERIDEAVAAGNGCIMAMPHLGGWDFGGAWFATQGYKLTVVVEPLEPQEMFDWFADFRRSLGMTIVPLGRDAGAAVLGALRRNEVVGLLSDRDIGGGGVVVEFFGERTTLPAGPATLAMRTGAPLLPCAVYFTGHHGHHSVVRPAIPVERTGRFREDVTRVTQHLARELEDLIRAAPEQWHIFQPNWPSDREEADRE
jgi:lauroyl/myristoyl acyltransferase